MKRSESAMDKHKFQNTGAKSELAKLTDLLLTLIQEVKEIKNDLKKRDQKWVQQKKYSIIRFQV